MAEEISFEDLGLKKPLDKMTAKELRDLVIAKLPMITGVSGMDKDAIIGAIKEAFGMTEEAGKVSPYKAQIHQIKKSIREMRVQKAALETVKERDSLRRKINKLKKRTRRLAAAV
ncbi:hypothetical protein [Megalodesulfovibrio gigas]|uniref:Rho termination factor N-terminal domain-containing protein n=1 Tax=Megalodesulfovibrio gigas (strain ATCC 19364 / DSM 1382 / NCIMB 9332 / VKM B-1759) TaxID=1121448 RepID=T2G8R2_MEGG1|nr:hypothetical protein [Megalodesulfovibrio gigas]AGW12980.1 hypothetical protein DGI_1108 [Megalodesulfovibrio gigas DSM 1382 = ATCC 19364]